jgi:hypothetical protein
MLSVGCGRDDGIIVFLSVVVVVGNGIEQVLRGYFASSFVLAIAAAAVRHVRCHSITVDAEGRRHRHGARLDLPHPRSSRTPLGWRHEAHRLEVRACTFYSSVVGCAVVLAVRVVVAVVGAVACVSAVTVRTILATRTSGRWLDAGMGISNVFCCFSRTRRSKYGTTLNGQRLEPNKEYNVRTQSSMGWAGIRARRCSHMDTCVRACCACRSAAETPSSSAPRHGRTSCGGASR